MPQQPLQNDPGVTPSARPRQVPRGIQLKGMDMEHTPGPWIAEEQFNPKDSGYRTTGRVFAHALHVASVHTAGSVRESDANARLISLCPELSDLARECARADSDCGESLRERARVIVAAMDRGQKS